MRRDLAAPPRPDLPSGSRLSLVRPRGAGRMMLYDTVVLEHDPPPGSNGGAEHERNAKREDQSLLVSRRGYGGILEPPRVEHPRSEVRQAAAAAMHHAGVAIDATRGPLPRRPPPVRRRAEPVVA